MTGHHAQVNQQVVASSGVSLGHLRVFDVPGNLPEALR